jgi:Salmonella virulence plasmid 65kDa B protein/Insecticide toxin TcdB middle/N-terminal region/FG-GAP-like repeat
MGEGIPRLRRRFFVQLAFAFISVSVPLTGYSGVVAGTVPTAFAVNDTGAATYSIPIQLPPGIAGLEPKLALVYNSQAGNGLLGVGWSVSGLSFISRCGRTIAQDGVNSGVSYDSNDRYCLDGQRLVMIGPANAVYGGDGTEYRTEQETYTRIVSHGVAGNGPAYFVAWTKSGQILEYGNTPDSRIEAQGKASVRVYAVDKISDTAGNYFTVSYTEDNANGDYYPSWIIYTGNPATPGGATYSIYTAGSNSINYVQFIYDTRTDVTPVYVGGSITQTKKRLSGIGTAAGLLYTLAYSYSPNNGPSLLNSVMLQQVGLLGSPWLAPPSFGWQNGSGDGSLAAPVAWGAPASPSATPLLGDIDGDGLVDMVYTSIASGSPLIMAQFSSGAAFGSPVSLGPADYSYQPIYDPDNGNIIGQTLVVSPIAVADVNRDGKADVITSSGGGAGNVRLSTGRSLTGPTNWGAPSSPSMPAVFGDIDGDGRADMVYISGAQIFVQFSTSWNFGPPVIVGGATGTYDPDSGAFTPDPIGVGDVNGDGKADVVVVTTGSVALSLGTSLASWASWGRPIFYNTLPTLADVNGDGLADLVYVTVGGTPNPSVIAMISNGAGFSPPGILGAADTWMQPGQDPDSGQPISIQTASAIAVGDVDGNGVADVVTVDTNPGAGGGNARMPKTRTPDLITTFTDSLGAVVSVNYSPLTNNAVYTPSSTPAVYPVRDVQPRIPLQLVSSYGQTDGIGGSFVTSYTYQHGRSHKQAGVSLGFESVAATTTPAPGQTLTTTKTFRQDYPFQGLPSQVVTTLASGAILKKVTPSWQDNPAVNSQPYSFTTGKYHRSDMVGSEQITNDLDGTPLPTVTTTTGYDAYGNAVDIVVATKIGTTFDGYSKATHNDYVNDTTNWFLGRLRRSQVTSTVPTSSLP